MRGCCRTDVTALQLSPYLHLCRKYEHLSSTNTWVTQQSNNVKPTLPILVTSLWLIHFHLMTWGQRMVVLADIPRDTLTWILNRGHIWLISIPVENRDAFSFQKPHAQTTGMRLRIVMLKSDTMARRTNWSSSLFRWLICSCSQGALHMPPQTTSPPLCEQHPQQQSTRQHSAMLPSMKETERGFICGENTFRACRSPTNIRVCQLRSVPTPDNSQVKISLGKLLSDGCDMSMLRFSSCSNYTLHHTDAADTCREPEAVLWHIHRTHVVDRPWCQTAETTVGHRYVEKL